MGDKDFQNEILGKVGNIEADIKCLKEAIRGDLSKDGNDKSILQRLTSLEISHSRILKVLTGLFAGFIMTGLKAWL